MTIPATDAHASTLVRVRSFSYLLVLLVLPAVWRYLSLPTDIATFPLGALWVGALAGTLRSLDGIFFHGTHGWKSQYDFWHLCSPFVGAAMGVVTYIIVAAGLVAAGSTADKAKSSLAVLAAAFIAAYNGDQFRALIQKTGNGLFGTPSATVAVTHTPPPTAAPAPDASRDVEQIDEPRS